ncbi:MAG: NYN domain-containing protein [Acidobacteriota bacterium]
MQKRIEDQTAKRIALLIDGDNAQPSLLNKILTESSKYGSVTIRRIYGDWTTSNMKGWKESLNNNAIQPIQQFRYTVGKNATDSAMIIDTMDILHGNQVDGFCLVSSDSDYTRLATRIREHGYFVLGIGKQTTPKAFVNACNIFIYTEILMPREAPGPQPTSKGRKPQKKIEPKESGETRRIDPVPLLKAALDMAMQEDQWANLATIGFYLHQLDPGFDPRNYGFKQLTLLLKNYPDTFELRFHDEGGQTTVYARTKEKADRI